MKESGVAPPRPRDPWVITGVRRYGKYLLLSKLAQGGMAEIFLAKQVGAEGFEKNVVIKRMLDHLTKVPEFVTMFLDEARLAAKLTHPNIAQILDLGEAEGSHYICMEYLPGEDSQAVIRYCRHRKQLVPVGLAARIVLAAVEGLEHAHEFQESGRPLHIVHRDVTPSNIIVTYQGATKLVDFGIAKAETKVSETAAGKLKGKVAFMSPEQVRGDEIDSRSDLFSLGLTFFELLTCKRMFDQDSELGIMKAVLDAPIPRPSELRPDIPKELEAIVMKALTRDRDARYQTAGQVRVDLEAFLRSTGEDAGARRLAAYMEELFGEAKKQVKTRIPTLADLRARGIELGPGDTAVGVNAPGAHDADITTVAPAPAEAAGTQPTDPGAIAIGRRARRAALAGTALVLVLVGGGAGLLLGRRPAPTSLQSAPAGSEAPGQTPASAAAGTAGLLPPGRPPSTGSEPPAPVDRPVPPPTPSPRGARDVAAARDVAGRPRTPRVAPALLSEEGVTQVVTRSRKRILDCFERHRDALPGAQGQVKLAMTIAQSGEVADASVVTPGIESSPLSSCIVEQVKALRFPRHVDKAVEVTVPFAYRVKSTP